MNCPGCGAPLKRLKNPNEGKWMCYGKVVDNIAQIPREAIEDWRVTLIMPTTGPQVVKCEYCGRETEIP